MHYHIISWNNKFGIISAIRYEDGAKSVVDFIDIMYNVFSNQLDEEEKTNYMVAMVSMVDEKRAEHVAHTSEKLSISWVGCNDDKCRFASNN